MKNSGIEWIGEIPDGWEVKTAKRFFIKKIGGAWGNEAQNDNCDRICLRIADFNFETQTIKCGEKTIRNYSIDDIKKLEIKQGELLIEKSGGGEKTPVGRSVLPINYEGCLYANFIDKLVINKEHNFKFVAYFIKSMYQCQIIIPYIKQTTGIQNLDVESFLSENVVYPTKIEQKKIADYLDEKSAKIDKLIELQTTMLEKLKAYKQSVITEAVTKGLNPSAPLKDSGIDWIGKIPQSWQKTPLKFCCSVNLHLLSEKEDDEKLIKYIDISSVNNCGEIKNIEEMFLKNAPSRAKRIVKENDIIISTVRTYLKSIARIERNYNGYICSTGFAVLTPLKNVDYKFLYYSLFTDTFTSRVEIYSNGISYPAINATTLISLSIPIPPLYEQQEIAEYLDKKCAKIDELIVLKQQKIERLKDYKKSIIYEYVTGKKEVV